MSKLIGIVLIFAAAWLMFKLQDQNGPNSGEGHESSMGELQSSRDSGGGSCSGKSGQEDDEMYTGAIPVKDRQDKS